MNMYDARGFPFSSISSKFVVAFPRVVTTTMMMMREHLSTVF